MNSWSLLRCVQNSTTELRWQRDQTIHQLLGYRVSSIWCWCWCFGYRCVHGFSTLDHRPFLFDSDLLLLDGCFFSKNAILFSPHPTEKKKQEYHPFANQHPEKNQILWNCETLTCPSCTSNLREQNVRLPRKNMRFSLMLISNLQSIQQNLSLGRNPIDSAELCCPHDNMVCDQSCDECKASLFTDRRKIKHFKTICEHTFEKSPTFWRSSICLWPNRKCCKVCWFRFSACFRKPKTLFTACWKSVLFFLHWPWLLSSSINVKSIVVFILLTLSPRSCIREINEYERTPILVMFSGPSDDDLEIFAQFILLKSLQNKRKWSLSFVCKWHCFSWDLQCFAPRERFLCTT